MICFLVQFHLFSDPVKHLQEGNLAFPTSQLPTPLVSFGQNIMDKGTVDIQNTISFMRGKNKYLLDNQLAFIYSFIENASLFIAYPRALRFKENKVHSSGPEDMIFQLEFAPYTKENRTSLDQLTIVGNFTIPTGSAKKNPRTGAGANTYFIGSTFSRVGINWFYFTSYGGIFNGSSHKTHFGNQFLYQYGFGKRIFSSHNWLFDWMIEFNGSYAAKDRLQGIKNKNSGGNVLFITPSLFLASKKHLVVQVGFGFPVIQQLNGHQNKINYLMQTKISWAF